MITRIKFDPEELQRLGLKTPELRDLGPLVVLAGPNGGGKTRHLQLIDNAVTRYRSSQAWFELDQAITAKELEGHRSRIAWELGMSSQETTLDTTMLRYEPGTAPWDPGGLTPGQFDQHVAKITDGSYSAIASGLHVYLEATARALWHGAHPDAEEQPFVKEEYDLARMFNNAMHELLGTTIEPELRSNSRIVPRLFGKPFEPTQLSIGQRVLICWAILLLRQVKHYRGKSCSSTSPRYTSTLTRACARSAHCSGSSVNMARSGSPRTRCR